MTYLLNVLVDKIMIYITLKSFNPHPKKGNLLKPYLIVMATSSLTHLSRHLHSQMICFKYNLGFPPSLKSYTKPREIGPKTLIKC